MFLITPARIALAALAVGALLLTAGAASAVPSNGKIAFFRGVDVWIMDADGTNQTEFTDGLDSGDPTFGGDEPAWSRDGTKIAYSTGNTPNGEAIVWRSATGGPATVIVDRDNIPGVSLYRKPSWSPDGTKIAFHVLLPDFNWEIYSINVDRTGLTRLTDSPGNDLWPAWSHDGTKIAFESSRDGDGEIWVMGADGSNPTQLTSNIARDLWPSWSPDDSQIAFWSERDGNGEIYKMNADGTNQANLTSGAPFGFDGYPDWSPDGSKIAFVSSRDGGEQIFVMNSDGTSATRITASPPTAVAKPAWQPVPAGPSGDVVVTDCDDPALAGLTVVTGNLIVDNVPGCAAVSLPNLTEVTGDLTITDNGSATGVNAAELATVGGDLEISGNSAMGNLDLGSLAEVTGDLTITDNGSATGVNVAELAAVGGNLELESAGATVDVGGAMVTGDLSLTAIGVDIVSASTGGGTTEVTVLGGTAFMRVVLPEGTFDQPVPFTIERQGDGAAEEGATAGGAPAEIDPVGGYRFTFGVPTLNQDAQLSFTIDLAQLDAETRAALLAGVDDGSATVAVRGDDAGDVYEAFARCTGTQTPAADGCVSAALLSALGAPLTPGGEPAFVRFDGVAGSFSTWAVALVTPLDSTPPTLTPTVTGTLGTGGWYTGDVSVSWTLADPESAVSAQSGCGAETVSTDTAGVTFTCEATSAGGTASRSVTLKRDATAPAIVGSRAPEANAAGWNNGDVTVTFSCTDALSGVASCTPASTLVGEGAGQSATGVAVDAAGNTAAATVTGISIDKTAPAVTTTRTPEPNADGWNNGPVTARFEAADALSGLDGDTVVETAFTSEGASQSASRTFTDRAGNITTATISVSIDLTAPEALVRYDPDTRELVVLGRDGLSGPGAGPAPFTRLPAADEGDDEDDNEARRRYLVADLAGNVRPLVIKVERDEDGEELTAKLEGDGVNKLTIELDDDELEQKIELGKGKDNETVRASYDGTRTRITVGKGGTKTTVTKPGLVLLRLVAGDGPLRVEY